MYHVINRGNYRRDVFGTAGAAQAFEAVVTEGCERYRWRLHAYVVMRNHYHLAITTPEPNLVEGMHWLQSTFATRFNRFRSERGHLFQGRYQALLIENAAALARVVSYIHLNPVRAGMVAPAQAVNFRWSSLRRFCRADRPAWLAATDWLCALGLEDNATGWQRYRVMLEGLAAEPGNEDDEREICSGWAIGTNGWRRAVAKDHAHLCVAPGIAADELRELKEAKWQEVLEIALRAAGKSAAAIAEDGKGAGWKRRVAETLRREAATPYHWIARALNMGSPNSVRSWLSRDRRNQHVSALYLER